MGGREGVTKVAKGGAPRGSKKWPQRGRGWGPKGARQGDSEDRERFLKKKGIKIVKEIDTFLGAKSTSIRDCVGRSVGRSVGQSPRCNYVEN